MQGKTVLLVDVSGSMDARLSGKSDMTRADAGYGLAIRLREVCERVEIFSFSDTTKRSRRGEASPCAMLSTAASRTVARNSATP